jgi:hypothetical protein
MIFTVTVATAATASWLTTDTPRQELINNPKASQEEFENAIGLSSSIMSFGEGILSFGELYGTRTQYFNTSQKTHGNSKSSNKPQIGYEIVNKDNGDVVKTGISGVPLNKNDTSPRANIQVNQLNKEAGFDKYEANIVKTGLENRQAALNWEQENTNRLFSLGNKMEKHKRPRPDDFY